MTRSTKGSYLPKIGRIPKAVNFLVTERDLAILEALGKCRYLRTGQISRLIFPESSTVQSARRRLKYLYHAGYVGRIQPMTDSALGHAEMAYFLEPAGAELLDDDTLPQFSRKGMVKPLFLRHALEVSEFRVNLELAVKEMPDIELHRAVMDFELKSHTEQAIGRRRYRLFDEILDPIGKRRMIVHPDLMFILKAEIGQGRVFQRLFFVEIDRGTEGLRVIADKLTGYHLYKREDVFKKFGDFTDFRVLFQTNSQKRLENVRKLVANFEGALDVWATQDSDVTDETVLKGAIWQKPSEDGPVPILRG